MVNQTENKVQKSVKVAGGVIAYDVEGKGETVLCLPSLGDTRREYERFAPELVKAGYRVITTDLRGMGLSRGNFKSHNLSDLSNDIKAILDAEGLKSAFLVACSVSGASAPLFAIENPARVKGLILFNPIAHTGPRFTTTLLVAALRTPGVGKGLWLSYFKSLYPMRPLDAEYLTHIKETLKQPGAMKSVADMCATPRVDERLSEVTVPTLIYFGTKDPDFKDVKAEAALTQSQIKQAEIKLLEGAGHYPQRECPELVVSEVIEWLGSHS